MLVRRAQPHHVFELLAGGGGVLHDALDGGHQRAQHQVEEGPQVADVGLHEEGVVKRCKHCKNVVNVVKSKRAVQKYASRYAGTSLMHIGIHENKKGVGVPAPAQHQVEEGPQGANVCRAAGNKGCTLLFEFNVHMRYKAECTHSATVEDLGIIDVGHPNPPK